MCLRAGLEACDRSLPTRATQSHDKGMHRESLGAGGGALHSQGSPGVREPGDTVWPSQGPQSWWLADAPSPVSEAPQHKGSGVSGRGRPGPLGGRCEWQGWAWGGRQGPAQHGPVTSLLLLVVPLVILPDWTDEQRGAGR